MSAPLRLDGAVRTSRRKTDARSPQQQRDMIEACAQLHGYDIVTVHDSGRDESGGSMNRATLNTVMERVRNGETDGLIVALTDRLSRAPIDEAMAYVRQLVETHHGVLVLADAGGTPVDLTDPMAETNLVLQLQMARQYRQGTAKRALTTRREAVKAGKFVGPTPLGYERRAGRLHPHPKAGPIVGRAFQIAAAVGVHDAVSYLRQALPGRRWDTDHVRRLLRSRTYLGESRSGAFVNEHAHEPLTDPVTWQAAQTDPRMRRSNGAYPLSHAVHCGRCGEGLVGQLQTVHGRQYRRMRCASPSCKGGTSINADKLEAHVHEVMAAALADDSFRDQFSPEGLADAERAYERAAREVARYLDDLQVRELVGDARWRAGLQARTEAEAQAKATWSEIAGRAREHEQLPLAGELDDPDQFARGLRAITSVGRIVIAPGRGAVADRARFVQGDQVSGALAA